MVNHPNRGRVFVGVFPAGICYADRQRIVGGDYAKLAFLPYATLALEIAEDCPPAIADWIRADAARIQAKRGQTYQVTACGQTVVLGHATKGA